MAMGRVNKDIDHTLVDEYGVTVDDEFTAYVDEDIDGDNQDYAGGIDQTADGTGDFYKNWGMPDQSSRATFMLAIKSAVAEAIDDERKAYQDIIRSAARVTTNLSGQVLFQRYSVPITGPIQIAREKFLRGNLFVANFTPSTDVYIGLHPGITVGGLDTIRVSGVATGTNPPRLIRTRSALWAIANTAAELDVQEEFD